MARRARIEATKTALTPQNERIEQKDRERRALVWHIRYTQGKSQRKIAAELGASQPVICELLADIRREKDEYRLPVAEARVHALAKLEVAVEMYHEIFEKSKEPGETIVETGKPGKDGKVQVTSRFAHAVSRHPTLVRRMGL